MKIEVNPETLKISESDHSLFLIWHKIGVEALDKRYSEKILKYIQNLVVKDLISKANKLGEGISIKCCVDLEWRRHLSGYYYAECPKCKNFYLHLAEFRRVK
jgi:hypothetical protein